MKFKLPKKIQDKMNQLVNQYKSTGHVAEEGSNEAVLARLIDGASIQTIMFDVETNEQFVVNVKAFDKLDTLELLNTSLGLRVSNEKESADLIYIYDPEISQMKLMIAAPEETTIGDFMMNFFNNTKMDNTIANYLYNTHSLATTI